MKHVFGILLIVIPWGFVSYLAKLELHSPGFLSLHGPGLGWAMRPVWHWKGGVKGPTCFNGRCVGSDALVAHPGCWVCWSRCWHESASGSMVSPFPLAPPLASLNPGSGPCVDPQQVTCTNGVVGVEVAERPVWAPVRARYPFWLLLMVAECSSGSILALSSECHVCLPFAMTEPADFRARHRPTDLHRQLTSSPDHRWPKPHNRPELLLMVALLLSWKT